MTKLPHSYPFVDAEVIIQCVASLESEQIGYDDNLNTELVRAIQAILPYEDVRLTPSASVGLMFLFKQLGLGSGDEVVMSSINCPSVYRAILAEGASPVLCDVRSTTDFRPSLSTIKEVISDRTRCIVLTHMFGMSVESSIIHDLKINYPDIILIEDFATTVPLVPLETILSDYGLLSFGSTKPVAAGIGGAVLCQKTCFSSHYDKLGDGLAFNTKLSCMDQLLLRSALFSYAHAQQQRQKLWSFYAQHLRLYGIEQAPMFRAIAFEQNEEIEKLKEIFMTAGYYLDVRSSVQHNLALMNKYVNLDNVMKFTAYSSLPFNKNVFQVVKNLGWLA